MIFAFAILGDLVAVAVITGLLCRVHKLSNGWIGAIAGASYALISITLEIWQGCLFDTWESMCGFLMGVMHLPIVLLFDHVLINASPMVTILILILLDACIGYLIIGQFLLRRILPR
ncbi:MAG: hypothetical protein Greene041662_175 [Candidatus Peregrinibacteria bacterium Greene0416_62]|nr:MAG: hypothetical protein Greene041662_175 [Candidatus Peregrinibacteria bacterium Greene0416_62]TSC99875.1 MAG: hypothetical protein Greene101449_468 [Candidatus Peregrinibacteria bacterium Greene1014_49]